MDTVLIIDSQFYYFNNQMNHPVTPCVGKYYFIKKDQTMEEFCKSNVNVQSNVNYNLK